MKHLLMIIAALAFVGTATATAPSAGCCPGACCGKTKCCAHK